MKKNIICSFLLVSLLVAVGSIGAIVPFHLGEPETIGCTTLKKFSSYEELRSFVKAGGKAGPYYGFDDRRALTNPSTFSLSESADSAPTAHGYSTTNIQVEGVDEADIVKTDGEYIYLVSKDRVLIVKAYPPEEAEVVSEIRLDGNLREIFINGDKLALFEEASSQTFIRVYDVSDRGSPASKKNVSVEGFYFNSRMIGDYVYAVINRPAYCSSEEDEVTLPKIYSNGRVEEVSATDIYYSNITDYYYSYTTIVAVNVQDDEQEPTYQPFLFGATRNMYVSTNNIYITLPNTTRVERFGIADVVERTIVHRIHVENGNVEPAASGGVPGHVLNQFSMDEYNGFFRIATTTGQVWGWGESASKNHVYILDLGLSLIGRLEDLAPGEKIYSARFMGDRGYLVTFKKVDPLFVLDLSNPSDPCVLGQLKITGYSDYLHPYDETHIIGIGKETIEAEEDNFAWYQGIKISLFDVSEVETPKEIDKYEIGDRGTDSPILSDHKAFLFDKSKNLLVIPVTVAEIDPAKYPQGVPPYTYGDFVWNGAYVFNISLEGGLELKGRIAHLDNEAELMKSGHYYQSGYSVKRSLYIGNVLYTISDCKIKMNSLVDMSEINELNLSE